MGEFSWKYWMNIALRKTLLYTDINLHEHHYHVSCVSSGGMTKLVVGHIFDLDNLGFDEKWH